MEIDFRVKVLRVWALWGCSSFNLNDTSFDVRNKVVVHLNNFAFSMVNADPDS